MKWFWRWLLILVLPGVAGLVAFSIINSYVNSFTDGKVYTNVESVPAEDEPRIAIVFGAGVWANGQPSHALYDRVATAVELYKAGRARKILMSGDNPNHQYDEPTVMKRTAVELGAPEADIALDFAGRRTYDTCHRAAEIFDVKRAILVTQGFHQARAIYLCQNLGVDSIGITANRRPYQNEDQWALREFFSIASAWFEINFMPFEPIGGEKEPIRP
jgi:vancomycin permeability regulator SanA